MSGDVCADAGRKRVQNPRSRQLVPDPFPSHQCDPGPSPSERFLTPFFPGGLRGPAPPLHQEADGRGPDRRPDQTPHGAPSADRRDRHTPPPTRLRAPPRHLDEVSPGHFVLADRCPLPLDSVRASVDTRPGRPRTRRGDMPIPSYGEILLRGRRPPAARVRRRRPARPGAQRRGPRDQATAHMGADGPAHSVPASRQLAAPTVDATAGRRNSLRGGAAT